MVSNVNTSYTKFCSYCEREVSRSRFVCERSGFRSWTFLLKRFSKRVPKDKRCDDTSMKTLIGVTTHTLNLVPGGGVLHNFQYGEVHANIWGLKFYVNQYLESVNYNVDKIQYLGSKNL